MQQKRDSVIDLKFAVQVLSTVWAQIQPGIVKNCFRKAGFRVDSDCTGCLPQEDQPDPGVWSAVEEAFGSQQFSEYVTADDDLTSQGDCSETIDSLTLMSVQPLADPPEGGSNAPIGLVRGSVLDRHELSSNRSLNTVHVAALEGTSIIPDAAADRSTIPLAYGVEKKHLPVSLCSARTVFVPKVDGAAPFSQLRPITVVPVLLRLFHKILANHLQAMALLDCPQRAFIPVNSCGENVHLLGTVLHEARRKSRVLLMATMDIAKAFDSITLNALVVALQRKKIAKGFVEYVHQFYDLATTVLSFQDKSLLVRPSTGVRQGDPMSPILFNLVVDEFLAVHCKEQTAFVSAPDSAGKKLVKIDPTVKFYVNNEAIPAAVAQGIRPSPDKVEVIRAMEAPTDIAGVRRLLGMLKTTWKRTTANPGDLWTEVEELLPDVSSFDNYVESDSAALTSADMTTEEIVNSVRDVSSDDDDDPKEEDSVSPNTEEDETTSHSDVLVHMNKERTYIGRCSDVPDEVLPNSFVHIVRISLACDGPHSTFVVLANDIEARKTVPPVNDEEKSHHY
ncbi:hypothetical protein MRX96_021018 [Rhipicephalus microplus]